MSSGQAQQYKSLNTSTDVIDADPHELIDLLFRGARDRLQQAKGFMQHSDRERTASAVNASIDIIAGLQASLDFEQGGEIAANLEGLYDYMQRRLFRANVDLDVAGLEEVADLIETLRSAWTTIAPESNISAG